MFSGTAVSASPRPCALRTTCRSSRNRDFAATCTRMKRAGLRCRCSWHLPRTMCSSNCSWSLLEPLGSEVDVVLETSHDHSNGGHLDLYREHIDMPVLKSILWEYEDMLLNDGCTGIAVLNPNVPQEVQFDEHKMLIVYGDPLSNFESIFTIAMFHTLKK